MNGAEFGKKPEFVKAVVYGGLLAVAMAVLGLVEGCATHKRAQQEGVSPAQPTNATVLPASRPELPATADSGTPRTATVERGSQGRAEARRPEVERSSPAHPGPRMTAPRSASKPPAFAALRSESSVASMAPPGSLPSPEEELWVIARNEPPLPPEAEQPGSGAMLAKPEPGKEVPLPLKHTDVKATISAYIATVSVTQQFQNPYDGKIEAVYVFPLPHNAAVNGFVMTIGERRIRGIIRERQEAEQIYQEAKRQGYVASLLTQERPNVFTQSVANIEPGKQIEVNITYFHTLAYADGWYEFVFPMVVGPRFNPAGSTEGIGAVARGQSGISCQKTEVQYLRPSERSGHDIALGVEVEAGVAVEEVVCRSHVITRQTQSPERFSVALSPNDAIPNKDFVLRYRVAGERIKSDLLTCRDERGGFFTLMIYPPRTVKSARRQPLEMVFVLDCSASMWGRPLEQAKQAVERALRHLLADDTFQIIRFSNTSSQLAEKPLAATPANIRDGLQYLGALNSEGGATMIHGVRAALDLPTDPDRLRFVCFLTDGYIGDGAEILGEVRKRLGGARIFSFGVGSAVNRYLLDHMAKLGRGAVAYLGPNDSPAQIMQEFVERISYPILTDVKIDWGDLQPSEVFPRNPPDLFVGRPVVLTGRFQGKAGTTIRISGKCRGEETSLALASALQTAGGSQRCLPSVWARLRIADLADQAVDVLRDEVAGEIKRVALDYDLVSPWTAFVAVDASQRAQGQEGAPVPVAVPVPDGVRYKTTVPEKP